MEILIPSERYDRMPYAQPNTLDTGARRLPVTIMKAGVLEYDWGRERVDSSLLQDQEFIDSLVGLPVMVGIEDLDHPQRVDIYNDGGADKAGVILSARYDATTQSIVGEVVLDTPEGIAAVSRGVRGVSLGYKAGMVPLRVDEYDGISDGATHRRTTMYSPNHLVLTMSPRGGPEVSVRADSTNGDNVDKIQEMLDACMARLDAMEASMAKMMAEEATEPEHQDADPEVEVEIEPKISAGEWRELFAAAEDAGIEISDELDLDAARKLIADKLIGAERADSLAKKGALREVIMVASVKKDRQDSLSFNAYAKASASVNANAPQVGNDRADAVVVNSLNLIGRA